MPIPSEKFPLPYATGLAERTDSRWTEPGQLTGITNGVFAKRNIIQKRFGHTALALTTFTDGTSISTGIKLGKLRSTLCLLDGHNYYSHNDTLDKWTIHDRIPELNAWRDPIVEWSLSTSTFDVAYGAGHIIAVWTGCTSSSATNNSVFASVIEKSTGNVVFGARLVQQTAATNYSAVRVVCLTSGGITYAVVCFVNATLGTTIGAQVLNLSSMVWSSTVNIVTDYDPAANSQTWDVAPINGGSEFVLLYPRDTAGTRSAKIIKVGSSLAVTGSATFGPPAGHNNPLHAAAICADSGENIWTSIGWDDGANTHIFIKATDPSTMGNVLSETSLGVTVTGTAAFKIANVRMSSTSVRTVWSTGSSTVGVRWADMNTSGTASLTQRQMYECSLVGKPFVQGGRVYAGLASLVVLSCFGGIPPVAATSNQGAYWLCDITGDGTTDQQPARPVTNLGPRIANTVGSLASANFVVSGAWQVSSTQWLGIGSFAGASASRYSLQQLVYNFADDTYPRWTHAEIGDGVFVSGGVTSIFDSQRFTEASFLHPPPNLSIASSNGAGALTPSGVYGYVGWYEWTDAKGQIQRSAAAVGSITMGVADDTNTITLTNLGVTTKQDIESSFNPVVQIRLARTTNGGASYINLTSDTGGSSSLPNTATQTYTDLVSDAALTALGFGNWYAQGGLLEGYAPPGFLTLTAHNNRIVGLGDDRITLWWSTEYVVGELVRFNDNLRVVLGDNGPITALASMDGVLYVFKASAIYAIEGSGWNEQGTQSDLSVPRALATDQGAIDQRSIVVTRQGIYFQSKRGIHLLSRGGEIVFIGGAVSDKTASYPVCRSSALYARSNEVRWELSTTETATTGLTVVYNYEFDAWSTFVRTDGSTASAVAVSSITCNDRFYWLGTGGIAYREHIDPTATSSYLDGSAWVTFSIESCWGKATGINGWQRWRYVSFVNEVKTAADITVSVGFDYNTTYTETHTFKANEMSTWTTFLSEAEYQVGRQKAESIRVKLSDATPTGQPVGTGQGSVYIGLVLDVAVLRGRKKLAPAQSA